MDRPKQGTHLAQDPDPHTTPLDAATKTFIQEVSGVFLFYSRAVDPTMLTESACNNPPQPRAPLLQLTVSSAMRSVTLIPKSYSAQATCNCAPKPMRRMAVKATSVPALEASYTSDSTMMVLLTVPLTT